MKEAVFVSSQDIYGSKVGGGGVTMTEASNPRWRLLAVGLKKTRRRRIVGGVQVLRIEPDDQPGSGGSPSHDGGRSKRHAGRVSFQ